MQSQCRKVEVYEQDAGYLNTKIIMDIAYPNYINTLGTTNATGDMTTTDGGLTWTIPTIVIGASTFT